MAETTADLLAQIERFLPPRYAAIRPHLAGIAAMFRRAEQFGDDAGAAMTVGGAEGAFLTLMARGYGVYPQAGESEDGIRERIRNAEGQVTRPAILQAVNALLAEFTADEAIMVEPWDDGYLDHDFYLDYTRICSDHLFFLLILPALGDLVRGASYLDHDYLDHSVYLGSGDELHPVYGAIYAAVNRLRAAGIRFGMALDL